jgi:hypothetical protein
MSLCFLLWKKMPKGALEGTQRDVQAIHRELDHQEPRPNYVYDYVYDYVYVGGPMLHMSGSTAKGL